MIPPLAYRVTDAAAAVSIDRSRIDKAISAGRLPAVNVAKRDSDRKSWRVMADDLAAWARAGYPTEALR